MTVFMTKVWGFGEPAGPLQFASEGWRLNALGKLTEGDRVVLVGTQGSETNPDERGRLLGIMQPTRAPAMSLDFNLRRADADFNEAGEYKWPVGLHNQRAWMLIDRPLLSQISDRLFSMDSAQGIVPLTTAEAAKVEALARREVTLLVPRVHASKRLGRDAGLSVKRGPPPATTTRRGVMHMRRAPAATYAMELVGARPTAIKVGWAFDPSRRCQQFNRAAMPTVGGIRYRLIFEHVWESARAAYAFEQIVLRHFASQRNAQNGEVVSSVMLDTFQATWARLLGDVMRGR